MLYCKEVKASGRTTRGSVDITGFQHFAKDILNVVCEAPCHLHSHSYSNPSSPTTFLPAPSSQDTLASMLFLEHKGCVLAFRLFPQGAAGLTPYFQISAHLLPAVYSDHPWAPPAPPLAWPTLPSFSSRPSSSFFLYGPCYILIYGFFSPIYHLIHLYIMVIMTLPQTVNSRGARSFVCFAHWSISGL